MPPLVAHDLQEAYTETSTFVDAGGQELAAADINGGDTAAQRALGLSSPSETHLFKADYPPVAATEEEALRNDPFAQVTGVEREALTYLHAQMRARMHARLYTPAATNSALLASGTTTRADDQATPTAQTATEAETVGTETQAAAAAPSFDADDIHVPDGAPEIYQVPRGWANIINVLDTQLSAIAPAWTLTHASKQDGQLSISISLPGDTSSSTRAAADRLLRAATLVSGHVCDVCSLPGQTYPAVAASSLQLPIGSPQAQESDGDTQGIRTRCPEHAYAELIAPHTPAAPTYLAAPMQGTLNGEISEADDRIL